MMIMHASEYFKLMSKLGHSLGFIELGVGLVKMDTMFSEERIYICGHTLDNSVCSTCKDRYTCYTIGRQTAEEIFSNLL